MEGEIVVTGGTGRLGKLFSEVLIKNNIIHTLTSRTQPPGVSNWMPMDIGNGKGIPEALKGKKILVHLASGTKKFDKNIDVNGTQRLLDAAKANGIEHFIYISIVGIDRVPVGYYKYKLEAEELIKKSDVPYTILRATQFHEFLDQMFHRFLFFPVLMLPTKAKFQPIDTILVAEDMYRLMQLQPENKTYDLGGPEVLELGKILQGWKTAQHKHKWILHLPTFGKTLKSLNNGGLTCPDQRSGGITWQQWLNSTYAR